MAKNIDYSASAERLTNPESVRLLLLKRLGLIAKLAELQEELEVKNAGLMTETEDLITELAINETEIRNTVLANGGYQDVEAGLYALRQRRVSYAFDPVAFRREYPKLAPAVIKEIVDTATLNGLIKGKVLNMAYLERDNVASPSETFAFIIKTTGQAEKEK